MEKTTKKNPIFQIVASALTLMLILNILPIQVTAATVTTSKYKYTLEDFSPIPLGDKYDAVGDFQHGVAFYYVATDRSSPHWGGESGLLDASGKELTGPIFTSPFGISGGPFREGLALVMNGRYCGYVNLKGEMVIPFSKKYVNSDGFFEGLAIVRYEYDSESVIATKFGYIDKAGKVVIPYQYGSAGHFSEGLANVEKNGRWGYINKVGKTVIPFEFSNAGGFSNGYAIVEKRIDGVTMEAIIDNTGKTIFPYTEKDEFFGSKVQIEYSKLIKTYYEVGEDNYIYEDYADYTIRKTRWTGDIRGYSDYVLLDKQGNLLTQHPYQEILPFSSGLAVVKGQKGKKGSGLIDKQGNEVFWIDNGTLKPFSSDGHAAMYIEGNWFILTSPLAGRQAKQSASDVLVNGKQTAFDAYNIGGNNYFKLRDLAHALNDSDKQFGVTWDGANNAILLTLGEAYTPLGGEMKDKGVEAKTATATSSKILLDGEEVTLTAYNIDGNNYFKLRDIGKTFDFAVIWDGTKNTISIDTTNKYTE